MNDTPDYGEFLKPKSDDALAELAELAELQALAEKQVELAEEELKKSKEALRLISDVSLPEKMDALGLQTFTTKSGLKITIKENIRANIPKEHLGEALAWLRTNGHGGVIKRVVKLEFGKGKDEQADELVAHLKSTGYQPADEAGVHFMTLGALARELLESGRDIPQDIFGIHRQRVSKLG